MAMKARFPFNTAISMPCSFVKNVSSSTSSPSSTGMLWVMLLTVASLGITVLPAAAASSAADHGLAAAAAASGAGLSANGDRGGGGGGGGGIKLSQIDGKSLFRSLRASSCSVDCSGADPEQVCGTDGVTYASRCELQRAKQCDGKRGTQGGRVKVRTKGPCPGDAPMVSKCFHERDEARKAERRPDLLIPSCNPDGTFSDVQCHTATRYCWCVTKDGKHIPGTSVKERRPRCKGRRRKRKGARNTRKKKKRKTSCTNKERQSFNTELVSVFREEYDRMLTARGPEAVKDASGGVGSDDEVSLEKRIVVWKFSQLDSNADDELSFKEIRSFRRMVKKLIKPRRCAKRFHRYCDKDNNRRIQKKEWTLCLWVDIKRAFRNLIPSDGLVTHNPHDKPRDESRRRNCLEERQAALQHALEEPSANVYIPRCQESGLWRQAQCHEATQYCWCVSEDSGMPLPGIATYRVEPNCSVRDDRQMKGFAFPGCPFEQKRRFIVDLIADMTDEMNQSKVMLQQLLSAAEIEQLNARELVARWKLRSMDKNRNDILERQEWRDLRKTLKKNKNYPRKCRRQFLRYCDENNDKTLSMEEWRDCLGLNHNLFNSLPRDPNRFGKRNPFQNQLT